MTVWRSRTMILGSTPTIEACGWRTCLAGVSASAVTLDGPEVLSRFRHRPRAVYNYVVRPTTNPYVERLRRPSDPGWGLRIVGAAGCAAVYP
jgi:hypothetical protein